LGRIGGAQIKLVSSSAAVGFEAEQKIIWSQSQYIPADKSSPPPPPRLPFIIRYSITEMSQSSLKGHNAKQPFPPFYEPQLLKFNEQLL
jgi:hypothetical protein